MRRRRGIAPTPPQPKKPPTLADVMKITVILNDEGYIWTFHDKAFPDPLAWVEYDQDANKLLFIGKRGLPMDVGLEIKPAMIPHYLNARQMMAAYVVGEEVKDMVMVPVVLSAEVENRESEEEVR